MVAPETARLNSMSELLTHGDILFDVGAEKGDISVTYSGFVGAQNMVLFESEPLVWPNIYQEWQNNGLPDPLACWAGLVGAHSNDVTPDYDDTPVGVWPAIAFGTPTTHRTYRYIHEHLHNTKMTSIDDWVARNAIIPRALTIDVEGAEYDVLLGAHDTLRDHQPIVWVSLHPDLMEKDYNAFPGQLIPYMVGLGYSHSLLGIDHEEHHLFKR